MLQPVIDLWTPGILVVATVCMVVTFFVRRIIETAFPGLQAVYQKGTTGYLSGWARWWNQVVLYSLPVMTGALLGLVKSTWLWPDVSGGVRILLGISVGWFSTLIYKVIRRAIKSKLNMDLPDVAAPQDAPESAQPAPETPAQDRPTEPDPVEAPVAPSAEDLVVPEAKDPPVDPEDPDTRITARE